MEDDLKILLCIALSAAMMLLGSFCWSIREYSRLERKYETVLLERNRLLVEYEGWTMDPKYGLEYVIPPIREEK